MTIKEVREKIAELMDANSALLKVAEDEKRDVLNEEEFEKWDANIKSLKEHKKMLEVLEVQERNTEWAKPKSEHIETELEPTEGIKAGENRAANKPYSEGDAGFGEFLIDVKSAEFKDSLAMERLEKRAVSGMSEGVPADGGFLVGTDYSKTILEKAYGMYDVTKDCDKYTASAGSDSKELIAEADYDRSGGAVAGGVIAYYKKEGEQLTEKHPAYEKIMCRLNDLTVYTIVTDDLLSDAPMLGARLGKTASKAIAFKTIDKMIRGDGNGEPLGILNAACKVEQAAETNQDADTIVAQNIIKMYSRMPGEMRPSAKWFYNQEIEPQLHTMGLSVGTGGDLVYMPANGLSGKPYATLYGLPAIPLPHCEELGTAGDIIFADFSQYVLLTKGGVKGASSIHIRFDYNETAFRWVIRHDGRPWWKTYITPYQGSATYSPFVTLASRT